MGKEVGEVGNCSNSVLTEDMVFICIFVHVWFCQHSLLAGVNYVHFVKFHFVRTMLI